MKIDPYFLIYTLLVLYDSPRWLFFTLSDLKSESPLIRLEVGLVTHFPDASRGFNPTLIRLEAGTTFRFEVSAYVSIPH